MASNKVTRRPVSSLGFGSFHHSKKKPLNSITKIVRDFIKPYEKSPFIPAWQSLVDSTNLYYTSCCNLYFSYRDAYNQSSTVLDPQAFQFSNKEFHDFEHTPEGFITTLGLGLTLVSFALIGSLSNKNDENSYWIFRWMNFLLPYIRIFLKQIKWVYKGIRYVLSILVQFGCQKELLVHVLFPLVSIMAIASVINRMWLRRMQDTRKEMQRDNMKLSEKLILSKTPVHELQKKPESYDDYRCSFIFLKRGKKMHSYYINALGKEEKLPFGDALYAKLHSSRVDDIHAIMTHHLQYLKKPSTDKVQLNLYDGPFDEAVLLSRYRRGSYIYLTNVVRHRQRRLCYIDASGAIVFDKDSEAFHQTYQKIAKQQTFASFTAKQLLSQQEVIDFQQGRTENQGLPSFQLGSEYHSYNTFAAYRDKKMIQEQDDRTANLAFFSAAMGGFFDGLYFYMGTVTLAIFTPQAYMILLAISVALLVTCMIVRVHEEYTYQRRHVLTCIQPKLELSKEAYKLLKEELYALDEPLTEVISDELVALIRVLETSEQERNKTKFDPRPIDRNSVKQTREIARDLILKELSSEIDVMLKLKKEQKEEVQGSMWTAVLAGLYNGLALQGVIASFMFVIVTLFYGTLGCPPLFVMGCLAVGIMVIAACCIQAFFQYQTFREVFDKENKQFEEEYSSVYDWYKGYKSDVNGLTYDAKLRTMLDQTQDYIDSRPFDPALDYMVVEWCEVWRLFLTGLSKGNKASFELFYNFLKQYDELWFMPVVLFFSALCFAIAFALHYIAKTFAPTPPNYIDVTAQDKKVPICRYDDESVIETSNARPSPLVANSFQRYRATTRSMSRFGSNNSLATTSDMSPLIQSREEVSPPSPAFVYASINNILK